MSLNWDITKVANHEALCYRKVVENGEEFDALAPKTESIIWDTMGVGMGSITKANAVEFYTRHLIWCRLHGYTPRLSLEDVVAHVGLRTNVSFETRAAFVKRNILSLTRDIEWKVREEVKKGGVAA